MKIIKSFGMVHLEKERKWYKILTIYKFSRLIIIIPLAILCFYSFVPVEVLRNASIVYHFAYSDKLQLSALTV